MIMEEAKLSKVKSLLYDLEKEEILAIISQLEDKEILYVYAYNYNWDNGFEIPELILNHDKCDLSLALLVFYGADGFSYLSDKSYNGNKLPWHSFIQKIYVSILDGKYKIGEIAFEVPLSKVQIFKLKKILSEQENIFLESIGGKNLNIIL